MKTWLHHCRNLLCIFLPHMLASYGLMVALSSYSSISNNPVKRQYPHHSSIIVKISQNSKIHRIKLYPDITNETLFFMAQGEQGKIYQLFVFDMDGRLVKQTNVRNRETTILSAFEKGYYLIEIFSNDERIENGSITIR